MKTLSEPPSPFQLQSTLESLTLHTACLDHQILSAKVGEIFQENPLLPGVILVEDETLLGMLSRQRFFEYMSLPFSLELYAKFPIQKLYQSAKTDILVLSNQTLVTVACRQSLQRNQELIYDPIVVEIEPGNYKLLDARELLLAQMQIHELAEETIRQSEAQLRQKTIQLEKALTDLKYTQSQLIQTEKMSSLGQLVAGVAHEINNPISFIYGNLQYVSQYTQDLIQLADLYQKTYPQPTSEIQDFIKFIDFTFIQTDLPKALSSMKNGAERIRDLVSSLRNFSRLDESELKAVNIHEGIENTLLILQNRLKDEAGNQMIEIVKNYSKLPLVECYAGQLNQVFINLLNNALDALDYRFSLTPQTHSNQTPTIAITTELMNLDKIRIKISDNGAGMNDEVHQRLFDPFFTTKPVGKGTGLGLSICYQIVVEKHKGQLICRSTIGNGSEFIIEIPIQQSKMQPVFSQCA
jgi:two-component system NtrC family sensor kinase